MLILFIIIQPDIIDDKRWGGTKAKLLKMSSGVILGQYNDPENIYSVVRKKNRCSRFIENSVFLTNI